jgi:hypothetical protein
MDDKKKFVLQFMAVICTLMACASFILYLNGFGAQGTGTMFGMLFTLVACLIAGLQ